MMPVFKRIQITFLQLLVVFLLLGKITFFSHGQIITCPDFTITGTSPSPYYLSLSTICRVPVIPSTTVWTNSAFNSIPNGFVKHTFNSPVTDVSIWYTYVNNDDIGTISINGGGIMTLSVASGCATVSGNILGHYTGTGYYGDVLVNVKSTMPFTEVTLVNTGGYSGHGSGDCASVIINSIDCKIDLGNDATLCAGDNLTLDVTSLNATYLWQDNSTGPTFTVTQPGKYWVRRTVNGCVASDTILVDYVPNPVVDLGSDISMCQGELAVLDATTAGATYLWQDNSTDPIFYVTESGTYTVQVSVSNCVATDEVVADVSYCAAILEMPNLFSPDNDGKNDTFIPIISINIVQMTTLIYNRWGEKVFETDNRLIEWDGKNASDGLYFWYVIYKDINRSEFTMKGWVDVKR